MSLEIGWFSFDGPFEEEAELQHRPGVFGVLSLEEGGRYNLLDVDEGSDVADASAKHARRECWSREAGGPLRWVAYYLPDGTPESRAKLVKEIRMQYVMPCSPSETPTHGWWRPEEQ